MIGSTISAVLLGLSAAAAWGAGDFSGGLASKRTSTYTVVGISQFISLILLVVFALLIPEGNFTSRDLLIGGLAGFFGALGLVVLYTGLARGPMGVVAPVTAVVSAIVPVVFSAFNEGLPTLTQILGIFIGLVAVWLISVGKIGDKPDLRQFLLPVLAGIGFGLYYILIDQVSGNAILWPLAAARTVSVLVVVILAWRYRNLESPVYSQLPIIALAGVFDTGGNVFFALASRIGRLDISAILSSLYPAMTVLLAWIILKERLAFRQWVGIFLVLIAVVLITI